MSIRCSVWALSLLTALATTPGCGDSDGDGTVTQEEAQAAAFNRVDENQDGYLTGEELRKAKPPHGGRHGPGGPGERGGPHGDP